MAPIITLRNRTIITIRSASIHCFLVNSLGGASSFRLANILSKEKVFVNIGGFQVDALIIANCEPN
jgi:hypothetical protein